MNSYLYRDARRQLVSTALAALTDQQRDLRTVLETEQAALGTDDWTVTDRTYLAVGADWLWSTRLTLKAQVDDDPALLALGRTATVSDALAAAIESIPNAPGGPPLDYLDQVRSAINQDETIFTELLHAAHRRWIIQPDAERLYPFDDVGVLLPLRLETLFDEPNSHDNDDKTRWKLSLRVIPDEASISRDNAHVSEGESKVLAAFWQAIKQPGNLNEGWLDGDAAGIAWQQLCNQVTPERAAWLVATLVPRLDGDTVVLDLPADMPQAVQHNRVGGMPPELHIVATTIDAIDGATHYPVGRLPMDPGKQIDAEALTLPLPGKPEDKEQWWASWQTAKAVGLGGEWLLPQGMTPQTIRALYVVGIGNETPDAHFKAQVDAGELAVLRLGVPTNTVRGKAAAELGKNATDWRKVAQQRLFQQLNPQQNPLMDAGRVLQQQLTGNSNVLPYFPGADVADETQESKQMVAALWPALWGYWLHDLWQVGDDAFRVGLWAFDHLCPESPLMPIRIADQPYGLLPVTALSQWEADATFLPESTAQRKVEMAMASTLNALRSLWASAVQEKRCVVGKSSSQFIELLGQDAVSQHYIWRQFAPAWAQIAPYQLDAGQREEFVKRALDAYQTAITWLKREPVTPYLANGFWESISLPLVQPTRMIYRHRQGEMREHLPLPTFLSLLFNFSDADLQNYDLEAVFKRWWVLNEPGGGQGDYQLSTLPDSLLIRLLIYACQTAFQWRRTPGGSLPEQHVVEIQQKAALFLAETIDNAAWRVREQDPFHEQQSIFTLHIPDERRTQLERTLRATLDSAAQRIDPWITGFAWQRLKRQSSSPRHSHRLGVYGWLDGPFNGRPGPTDAGRLHTPSYNQTLAALIMRDKFLSSTRAATTNETGDNPWKMNITSSKARLAEEIADEVRMGFHIYEIVGRHVENIIGVPQTVKELRTSTRYAMHPERRDPNEVCNGHEALQGLLAGDPAFHLSNDQKPALQLLSDALDTYGDLLMADGVMQLINRQVERAAETMEAAPGFSRPPTFEFTRTPPSGYQLESLVLSTLPFVSFQTLAENASPGRLADPSVAAFIESKLGDNWAWQAINADDDSVLGTVTLTTLGLVPIDTLGLSDDLLRELVRRKLRLPLVYISESQNRAWLARDTQHNPVGSTTLVELNLLPEQLATLDDATLHSRVRVVLGVAEDTTIEERVLVDPRLWIARDENGTLLGMVSPDTLGLPPVEANDPDLHRRVRQRTRVPQVRINAPRQHQLAQQLVAALSNRPAAGRDFTSDAAAQQNADTDIYDELRRRYENLHSACQKMIDDLRDNAANDSKRADALHRALSWGVTSMSEAADREALMAAVLGIEPPAQATPLATLTETAAKALEDRLAAAPKPADLAPTAQINKPLHDHDQLKQNQVPDGTPTLAQAIAVLASPHGKLAILACWSQDTLLRHTKLMVEQTEQTIDEQWLTVVAAPRANIARLEAIQLEIEPPLDAWSSSPSDPWQMARVKENLAQRNTDVVGIKLPRFVAAYGVAAAWAGDKVAVGLIDAFSEAIPMPQRSTMTAFGFNAPSARAPQAILLAVPPKPRQRLSSDLLVQIIEETQELAHARTAPIEDLGNLQAMTPTMWLQSSGPVRIRLEAWPLFE